MKSKQNRVFICQAVNAALLAITVLASGWVSLLAANVMTVIFIAAFASILLTPVFEKLSGFLKDVVMEDLVPGLALYIGKDTEGLAKVRKGIEDALSMTGKAQGASKYLSYALNVLWCIMFFKIGFWAIGLMGIYFTAKIPDVVKSNKRTLENFNEIVKYCENLVAKPSAE